MSAYDIKTTSIPTGGECSIAPVSGISLATYFNLSCSGWKSSSTPLTYEFQYKLQPGLNSVIYRGLNNFVIAQLPPGDVSHNLTLNFTVTVTDKNGASVRVVNLSVQVFLANNISSDTVATLILANDSLLKKAVRSNDLSKAVELANTALQAFSHDDHMDQNKKTEINEVIVKNIVSLQVNSLAELLQISSVIGSATQDNETVSDKNLNYSLDAITSMTSLLTYKAQAKNTTDIRLIIESAENLGTCLNNMLKTGARIAASSDANIADKGNNVVKRCMKLVSNVSDAVLELNLPDEEIISIRTVGMTFALGRHTAARLAALQIESGDGKFVLPAESVARVFRVTSTSFVDTQMVSMSFNPFTWDITRERIYSDVLTLELKDDKRKTVKVSQLPSDVTMKIPLKQPYGVVENSHLFIKKNGSRFHEINVDYEKTLIQIETHATCNLIIFMRFGSRPTSQEHDLNGTVSRNEICVWTRIQGKLDWKRLCSPNEMNPIQFLAQKAGKYYVEVQSDESFIKPQQRQKRSCFGHGRQKRSCVQVKSPPPTPSQIKNVSVVPSYDASTDHNYTLRVALASCVYWSDDRQMWTTEGCQVLSATVNGFINCSCNHLTSFGGSLLLKPNRIDFDKVFVEFAKLGETGNVSVIVSISLVFVTYFVVIIIVRREDRKDAARIASRVRELPTSPENNYEYKITITTGIWRNAGTTAKVAMDIYGTEDSTEVINLSTDENANGSLFYRGSSEVFLLTVKNSLGCVNGLRIGHDNTGVSPSWFLEDVVILDVQTLNSWTFHNRQWLALERGDGRIERVLNHSSDNSDFNREVWKWWRAGLTEKHAWVSVLAKLSRDSFSRVQRTTCCLSILMSAMLANALFYDVTKMSSSTFIQVGPLKFTWRQVIVGVQSALIVAPVNILIAFLFEKGSLRTSGQQNQASNARKCLINVAWILCFFTSSISATLTFFYSLVWEKRISEQWLSSMVISFIVDVTITEPTKLFVVALFLAVVRNKKQRGKIPSAAVKETEQVTAQGRLFKMKLSTVEEMRKCQARKQNLSRFVVELVVYGLFIAILMIVCYGNRNDHRYFMTKSIREGLPRFHKVSNNTQYWSWVRTIFVPGIYAGSWYNFLIGMPRLTQLRVKPKPCEVSDFMKTTYHTCHYAYSKENEETTPYSKPGWLPVDNYTKKHELMRLCPKPWRYETPDEANTVTKWGQFSSYPGGGFVADLGYKNSTSLAVIEALNKYGWLDVQTRPVILEFSAFNPPTNLLVVVNYFYETQSSGYKATSERIDTISLSSTETGYHHLYLLCTLIFIVFVFFFVGRVSYAVYKQKLSFLKLFWNWIDIFEVLFALIAVAMNIIRSSKAVSTIRKMKANIYASVNFQDVSILSEIENAVLGVLIFLVTLKLLRLIRYNKHVGIFSRTFKIYSKIVPSMSLVFAICFVAFMHFGILAFGSGSERYSSLLKATYFQLELILGRVKTRPINQLSEANRAFGRIFSSFILLSLTILLMNFFIVTLNDALVEAKSSVASSDLNDLLDEKRFNNEERNKKFFDFVSKSIKEISTNGKRSVGNSDNNTSNAFTCKVTELSRKKYGHESTQIVAKSCRSRKFFDTVSASLKQLKRNPLEQNARSSHNKKRWVEDSDNRKATKASREIGRLKPSLMKAKSRRRVFYNRVGIALKRMRGTPLTKREIESHLNELQSQEEKVLTLIRNITNAEYSEERMLNFLLKNI